MVYLLGIALMGSFSTQEGCKPNLRCRQWCYTSSSFLMTWKGAPTEEKMQKGVDQVSDSCDSYDLTISIKKIEVVYQPAPGKKGKRKVQGVPQSQTAALPRPQEEQETDKSKQAQTEQTYEKH